MAKDLTALALRKATVVGPSQSSPVAAMTTALQLFQSLVHCREMPLAACKF